MKVKIENFWRKVCLYFCEVFGNLFLIAGALAIFKAALNTVFFIILLIRILTANGIVHSPSLHILVGFNTIVLTMGGISLFICAFCLLSLVEKKKEKDNKRSNIRPLFEKKEEK